MKLSKLIDILTNIHFYNGDCDVELYIENYENGILSNVSGVYENDENVMIIGKVVK